MCTNLKQIILVNGQDLKSRKYSNCHVYSILDDFLVIFSHLFLKRECNYIVYTLITVKVLKKMCGVSVYISRLDESNLI